MEGWNDTIFFLSRRMGMETPDIITFFQEVEFTSFLLA